jgi:hypothetical protein
MSDVSVNHSGPLFSGAAAAEVHKTADQWAQSLATTGAADIRATQNVTFRTQTPHARLQTEARAEAPGWKIWDQRLIYGPWLEGTGSRNRTTRFKGYGIWRAAASRIQARAVSIGQPIVAKFVGRMNA